jgi:hypothetical protein
MVLAKTHNNEKKKTIKVKKKWGVNRKKKKK